MKLKMNNLKNINIKKMQYQPIKITGQYKKVNYDFSKDEYLKQLNAKLEKDYQRGLKRASDNAWKGQLTYFNL